jgi:hypothetical protein
MKEISREEYLKALDIVEGFHRKVCLSIGDISNVPKVAVRLSDFLAEEQNISRRLSYCLDVYIERFGDVYIEDVCRCRFFDLKIRGMRYWSLFNDLREEYLDRKKIDSEESG